MEHMLLQAHAAVEKLQALARQHDAHRAALLAAGSHEAVPTLISQGAPSSSGLPAAAAHVLEPQLPPGSRSVLPFPAPLPALWECGADLWQTAQAAIEIIQENFLPLASSFVAAGTVCGCNRIKDEEESDDDEKPSRPGQGLRRMVTWSLGLYGFLDTYTVTTVLKTLHVPIAVHLRTWALGGVLLSFPISWIINKIARKHGIRWAFVVEVFFAAVAYWWLVWGTHMLSAHPEVAQDVPYLWWPCFIGVVVAWSGMSACIVLMVLMTILTLIVTPQA